MGKVLQYIEKGESYPQVQPPDTVLVSRHCPADRAAQLTWPGDATRTLQKSGSLWGEVEVAPDTKDSSFPCTGISPLLTGGGEGRNLVQLCFLSPQTRTVVNSWFSPQQVAPLSQVTLPLPTCPSKARCPHRDCTCHLSPSDCLPPVSQSGPRPSTAFPLGAQYLPSPWGGGWLPAGCFLLQAQGYGPKAGLCQLAGQHGPGAQPLEHKSHTCPHTHSDSGKSR